MAYRRVRPLLAAVIASHARCRCRARRRGSRGLAGASPFASAPIAVSFAAGRSSARRRARRHRLRRALAASSLESVAESSATELSAASGGGKGKRGEFKQVGHEPLFNRGMNAAIAVHDDYAYVGSRTDGGHSGQPQGGLLVVDISKPSKPRVTGPPLAPIAGESTRELRVWRSQDMLIVLNRTAASATSCITARGCRSATSASTTSPDGTPRRRGCCRSSRSTRTSSTCGRTRRTRGAR